MKKYSLFFRLVILFLLMALRLNSQNSLTIDRIMQGDHFTGFSPDNLRWSPDGAILYFDWNPDMDTIPSLYSVRRDNLKPQKVGIEERKELPSFNGVYNRERSKMVWSKDGDLFLVQLNTEKVTCITNTTDSETNPMFGPGESTILFTRGNNLFSWDITDGTLMQLTDFRSGKEKKEELPYATDQDT